MLSALIEAKDVSCRSPSSNLRSKMSWTTVLSARIYRQKTCPVSQVLSVLLRHCTTESRKRLSLQTMFAPVIADDALDCAICAHRDALDSYFTSPLAVRSRPNPAYFIKSISQPFRLPVIPAGSTPTNSPSLAPEGVDTPWFSCRGDIAW